MLAFRNEELRIQPLLDSLNALDFPKENLEIIMVDDHSSDESRQKIEKYAIEKKLSIRVFSLPEGKSGKKAAIALAKEKAGSDLLFFTDADVRLPSSWIMDMLACQQNSGAAMVCSEVEVIYRKGILNMFESLEQAALVALSAASVAEGKVFLCNGAGYLVKKDAIGRLVLPEAWHQVPGGDDVMLLHAMHKAGQKIAYCRIAGSRVQVEPAGESEFLQQRIRWGSKVFLRSTSGNFLPAFSVWLFHAFYAWLLVSFGLTFGLTFLPFTIFPGFLTRGLWESILVKDFLSPSFRNASVRKGRPVLKPEDIERSQKLKESPDTMDVGILISLLAPLYSLYVSLAGPILLFYRNFTWKGRAY